MDVTTERTSVGEFAPTRGIAPDGMRHLDLFSGIGGFALAASWVWPETHRVLTFVERDPFCRAVLRKHWPGVPQHDDIRTYDARAIGPVDLVTGGYPCQPYSTSGRRTGEADDRALWPEMRRVIDESRPRFVVGENVAGHVTLGLDGVLSDLEALGYACRTVVVPAAAVGAPHRRERVWILAADPARSERAGCIEHTDATGRCRSANDRTPADTDGALGEGWGAGEGDGGAERPVLGPPHGVAPHAEGGPHIEVSAQAGRHHLPHVDGGRDGGRLPTWAGGDWIAPAPVCGLRGVDDGLPGGLDRRSAARARCARLQALGNAIVPEVAFELLLALAEVAR